MTRTLAAPARFELEVKKSRFLALGAPCSSDDARRDFLKQIRDPSATHHCWGWKAGQRYRFDDDGEPGGTAGRPILSAIEQQGLDEVAVVVIRYYGGIKLGTGGLARAYGASAAECLRQATTKELIVMTPLRVQLPFELIATAHQILERHGAVKRDERYSSEGVDLDIECPAPALRALRQDLQDASAGQARVRSD